MNSLKESILESIRLDELNKVSRRNVNKHVEIKYIPHSVKELKKAIDTEIEIQGLEADLNCIDVSNLDSLFMVFTRSKFNGDISKWDVSKVKDMGSLFHGSAFNGDISNWDVSNVEEFDWMFADSEFKGDISNWDVSNAKTAKCMFYKSKFDGNIDRWTFKKLENDIDMFSQSNIEKTGNYPAWYKKRPNKPQAQTGHFDDFMQGGKGRKSRVRPKRGSK